MLPGMALISLAFISWFHFSNVDFVRFSQTSKKLPHKKFPSIFGSHNNPSMSSLPSEPILPFKNILWAHVGKAGGKFHVNVDNESVAMTSFSHILSSISQHPGNSFRVILKAYCESDKKHIDEKCSKAPDNMLSNRIKGFLHDEVVRPKKYAIQEADAYLFNLRHPVDRMISWYHYEHPHSCMHNRATKLACGAAKDIVANPNGITALFYKKCFPKQEILPFAFSKYAGRNKTCSRIAREVIQGRIEGKGFKHIWYNNEYYFNETVGEYPSKGVLVVRTESLWDDLKDLDLKLGGYGSFGSLEGLVDSHGSETYRQSNSTFSDYDFGLLCCGMQDEMHIYRRLLERALNLDEAAKSESITAAAQRCGFSSWNEMVNDCTNQKGGFGLNQIDHDNPAASLLPASPPLSYDNIMFVHVGKAGGNTLRVLFKVYCQSDRHRIDKGCNDSPDSMLSDQVAGFMHSNFITFKSSMNYSKAASSPDTNKGIANAEAFLFSLRNPVDRAMSWYHYEHPQSCLHNTATRIACHTAIDIANDPRTETALFFQTCFPSQHDFVAAFNRTGGSALQQACNYLARRVIQGKAVKSRETRGFKPRQGFKHISYNMRYYLNLTLDLFPDRDVLVVRTENMWDDLKDLDLKLGGYGIFGEREGYQDSHGSETYKKKDALSVEEYGLICCALRDEMELYRQLLERAINLDAAAKETTIVDTAKRCGFSSWDDMVHQCTIHESLVASRSTAPLDLESPILPLTNITFVHVDKIETEALSVILKGFCESNTPLVPDKCTEALDSTLSDQVTGYVYGSESLPTEGAIDSAKAFLFNLGHPVDYLMSWYHYERPHSCSEGHRGRLACETLREILKHPQGDAALFFKTCFPTTDLLLSALNPNNTDKLSSRCIKLAQNVVDGRISGKSFKHVSNNIRSYAKRTVDKYPKSQVLVVRTETLWDDLKDLDFQLGGSGAFVGMEESLRSTRNEALTVPSEQYHDTLSAADYGLLCCVLLPEMQAYQQLLKLAVNLDKAAKEETLSSAVERCGFTSWTEMEDKCLLAI